MRFLHTADWHLGRLFHQVHLTEDQAFVLRQLVDVARDARVDAVVVAGDVYDRAVPPPEAVGLLDDVLSELLLGLKVPVVMAAGNHDSPERLAFGARVLARQGLHLFGRPSAGLAPVVLGDAHGTVSFYVAPYAEPALIRECLAGDDVVDHQSGMRALLASMLDAHPARGRSVFVGHAFVNGALGSDSERPLSVGGAGAVDPSTFGGFQYVALGHLHRPQDIVDAGSAIRYAGALLEYSFDEVGQRRSVTIVDIDGAGAPRLEEVPLVPRRALRRIEGTLEELLHGGGPSCDDYVVARLLDRHPVLDPIGRLRGVYPNILCIERPAVVAGPAGRAGGDRRQLGHGQLFAAFFQEMTGGEPTPEEQAVFDAIDAKLAHGDREVEA
jgi:DNA repair protein SbcD/Mre11